jgi:uncharacterized protein (DUF433 family)
MDWRDRIEVNPKVLLGKPVIKGTRLAVEFILELLAERWTDDRILQSYPQLSHEDIRAALKYVKSLQEKDREL